MRCLPLGCNIGLIVASSLPLSALAETLVDWEVMASAHSPAQPISTFIEDWDAPLKSGTHAYLQARTGLKVRSTDSAMSYGLGWRYDYLMQFNQDTADLYWQYKNNQLPDSDQTYLLALHAAHNERVGANVGFTKQILPNWQLTTYANLWQGRHVLEGDAHGSVSAQAVADSDNIRNIDRLDKTKTDINYYYDKPALSEEDLNWFPDKPSGYGYSLDVELAGALTDKTALSIRGYDMLGRMHWQDAPSTEYVLDYDSDRRPIDKTGGQLATADVTQTLPWRVEASVKHQLSDQWQLGAHGQANDIQTLYQLSAGYQMNNSTIPIIVTGLVEPQTKALGLTIDSRYGGIKLLTDDLDFDKARRSEISLYGRYQW